MLPSLPVNSRSMKSSPDQGRKYSITIVIPVYNEEKTIQKVLSETVKINLDFFEIIIVDDASKDSSLKLIKEFVAKHNNPNISIKLVKHKSNRGKGAGIRTALKHAKGEYFIIQDADLEYAPKDIVKLHRFAIKKNHDVVYGSRFKGKIVNMPKPNYIANHTYNFILRRLYKTSITDMHTCYKMLKTELFNEIKLGAEGFDYATELVSKLLKKGYVIHEVPISFKGRSKKEGKKINFVDGLVCIRDLLYYRFN